MYSVQTASQNNEVNHGSLQTYMWPGYTASEVMLIGSGNKLMGGGGYKKGKSRVRCVANSGVTLCKIKELESAHTTCNRP